jgi:ribokinase
VTKLRSRPPDCPRSEAGCVGGATRRSVSAPAICGAGHGRGLETPHDRAPRHPSDPVCYFWGMQESQRHQVAVVGQIGRDLVLHIDDLPDEGGSSRIRERIERLGGKGANQAVGLRQLGADATLIGVVGDDAAGEMALDDAVASGIDVSPVVRRGRTALLVDVVEPGGRRRLLEDVPQESLLTEADVRAAEHVLRAADTVALQLQQPGTALLSAARIAAKSGARIVLDGAIDGPERDELLTLADVLRADVTEAALLTGAELTGRQDAEDAARRLLTAGPTVVALAVPGEGNVVVWAEGSRFYPHTERRVVDPTGAGDAFLAGLIVGLSRNGDPEEGGAVAADAASSTVSRLGGRPDLRSLGRAVEESG